MKIFIESIAKILREGKVRLVGKMIAPDYIRKEAQSILDSSKEENKSRKKVERK